MAEHSLTPWKIQTRGDTILSAKGEMICRVPNNPENGKNWENDRAFIVKAVNAYPDLVKALEHALVRFECLADHFQEAGDNALWAMSDVDADRMRAALSTIRPGDVGGPGHE